MINKERERERERELAGKKIVPTRKCMLNTRTKVPICMTWKADHVTSGQGSEEETSSPEQGRRPVDIQEGTDLQKERCR
jgi:hypothetical protein